jgi:hypothetical protein
MKSLLRTLSVVLLLVAGCFAQVNKSWYFAADYGQWSIPSQFASTYIVQGANVCLQSNGTSLFFPFNTNAPVLISDVTSLLSEVVTASTVVNTSGRCGITATTVNAHNGFYLKSGTAGLQEAINALGSSSAYPQIVYLDTRWYQLAGNIPHTTPAAIIAAAAGNSSVILVDLTTSPTATYDWNGTKYAAISGSTAGAVTPVVAATAGSGTSPTIAAYGSGSSVLVNLTPAATTATGSIFTLAYSRLNGSVMSGTYTSGITATGVAGQNCNLGSLNNSSTATATVVLTGTNTIAGSTPLVITSPGASATAAPTSATASNGTATCSGTATISTSLGATAAWTYAPSCTIQSVGANTPAGSLTVAAAYSSPTTTVTASIGTTALTATTAYQFKVTCQ